MSDKPKILIVNPLFRDLFISNSKKILSDSYQIDEFFELKPKTQNKLKIFLSKILNLVNLYILKNKDYYKQLEKSRQQEYYKNCLARIKNKSYEKVLFCRGDRMPTFVLENLAKQAKDLINYQCDGVEMCPDIFEKKKYFTKIYSFEKDDIVNYPDLKMNFITNFYFKDESDVSVKEVKYDFYYLGVGIDQRIKILGEFDKKFSSYKNHFLLSYYKPRENDNSIQYLTSPLDYKTNLEETSKALCLIDLKLDSHNGLSFRFFEALYLQKKLITNNIDVINYDFYNPNNILIIDYNNFSKKEVEDFLELKYVNIDQNIVEKYAFNIWLKQILNLE